MPPLNCYAGGDVGNKDVYVPPRNGDVIAALLHTKILIKRGWCRTSTAGKKSLTDALAEATTSVDQNDKKIPGYLLWAQSKQAVLDVMPAKYVNLVHFNESTSEQQVCELLDIAIKHVEARRT